MLNNPIKLDLCSIINQLNSDDRYVFFPFSALKVEAQLIELSKNIALLTPDKRITLQNILHYDRDKSGFYGNFISLRDDILSEIKTEFQKCFELSVNLEINSIITTLNSGYLDHHIFHFDPFRKGIFKIIIPILGDTTVFSKSLDKTNPGTLEHLPKGSMAIFYGNESGPLHSAPIHSKGSERYGIQLSLNAENNILYGGKTIDHPSINDINKASIENEIIYEASILKHDSVSVFGEILPVLD